MPHALHDILSRPGCSSDRSSGTSIKLFLDLPVLPLIGTYWYGDHSEPNFVAVNCVLDLLLKMRLVPPAES